jgi:hypothetical protein
MLECITMVIFGILASWKCDFCSFVNGCYKVNEFGFTCVGNRNISKYHFSLIVKSDCWSSYSRIPHLCSCVCMSNDESLIYVLIACVFHNVHFRHFGEQKMRFLLIRQRVLYSQWICIAIRNICKYHFFLNVISDC